MDDNQVVSNVIQKQATVGEIIDQYIHGKGIKLIADEYGIDSGRVRDVIQQADREGKLMPPGASEALVDKVSDTPEPLTEGENPPPGKGASFKPKMATTENSI